MHADIDLAGHMHGVEALFFKDDRDPEPLQLTDVIEAVYSVSCKPGYRLREDHIDFSVPAKTDHTHEFLAFVCLGAGDSLIGENPGHRPFWIFHDFVGVVASLCLKGHFLLVRICRDTAVSGNTQLLIGWFCLLWQDCRRDDPHTFLLLYLFHGSAPPAPADR